MIPLPIVYLLTWYLPPHISLLDTLLPNCKSSFKLWRAARTRMCYLLTGITALNLGDLEELHVKLSTSKSWSHSCTTSTNLIEPPSVRLLHPLAFSSCCIYSFSHFDNRLAKYSGSEVLLAVSWYLYYGSFVSMEARGEISDHLTAVDVL